MHGHHFQNNGINYSKTSNPVPQKPKFRKRTGTNKLNLKNKKSNSELFKNQETYNTSQKYGQTYSFKGLPLFFTISTL